MRSPDYSPGRIIRIRFPSRLIVLVRLIAPVGPAGPRAASEQFQIGSFRAAFDQIVLLVGLARVFTLSRRKVIHLTTPWGFGPGIFSANAKEEQFRHVPEVKADATSIRTAVLADLMPNDVRFVFEAPGMHNPKAVGQERIGDPHVQMSRLRSQVGDRQRTDIIRGHGFVPRQSAVLGRNLASPVREAPRRIGENGLKPFAAGAARQVDSRIHGLGIHSEHPHKTGLERKQNNRIKLISND